MKCSILGCNQEFIDNERMQLHAATSWHCISCGYSDNSELTIENIANKCIHCLKPAHQCIKVDFKKKAYVVNGTLSLKENGRWVHYE
ncbi:hypothetical protein EB118_04190 [bacterium]|nr:hypothetical protein [bacterium]